MTDRFKQEMEEFKKEVDADLVKLKRKTARIVLRKIMKRSPVWTGAYVKSHRVGISKTTGGRGISRAFTAPAIRPPGGAFPAKMSEGKAKSLKQEQLSKLIPYISTAQLHDVLTISNSAPHAAMVEYIGWKTRPAYQVYNLAAQEVRMLPITPGATEIIF